MDKTPNNKKPILGKRNLIAAIVFVATVGLLFFFVIRPQIWNNPAENPLLDNGAASSENNRTIAPDEIGPDEILFTINGKPIPMSIFGYFLYHTFSRMESMFMTDDLDFYATMSEGMSVGQYVLGNAVDSLRYNIAAEALAEESEGYDRAKTEADADAQVASIIADSFDGDENSFRYELALMGTTLESYRDITISQILGNQVFEQYYGDAWVAFVDPADYYDQFVTTTNILLLTVDSVYDEVTGEMIDTPLSDEVIAQKRALADTILEELNAGGDFFELLNLYGEDPSLSIDSNPGQRYTFQEGEMVYDYSSVAFAMEVGEYSGIIESSYGFYIIYKLPLDTVAVGEAVVTDEFRYNLFNSMLDDLSYDYTYESTSLFDTASLDIWYSEYKEKNH